MKTNQTKVKQILTLLAAAGSLCLAFSPAPAFANDNITWTASATTSSTDVNTSGTLVMAYAMGQASANIVNGVSFAAESFNNNANTYTYGTSANGGGSTTVAFAYPAQVGGTGPTFCSGLLGGSGTTYNTLLSTRRYCDTQGTLTITISGLTSGTSYTVQFWQVWGTGQTRTVTYSDGNGNTITCNQDGEPAGTGTGPNQYSTGTFTASGTTETITVTASSAGPAFDLTMFQLRSGGGSGCVSPTAYQVTGGANCGGSVSVGVANSQTNANYQLFTNGVAYGAFVAGTGSALTPAAWSNLTFIATYTVVATNATGGCTTTMTGQAAVSKAPTTTYNVTGGGCSGSHPTVGLSSSDSGVTYLLLSNNVVVGSGVTGTNGQAISFGVQTGAGTYTVEGTNGCGIVPINGGSPNSVVITGPGAPTSPLAVANSGHITVSWTAPGGTVNSYNVYRGISSGGETLYTNVLASPFVNNNVVNGTQYFYKITALNGGCEGPASAEVSAGGAPSTNKVAQIIWAVQPGNTGSGTPFNPQPVIETADQFGSPTTIGLPAHLLVTIAITNGGADVLSGTTNYDLGTAAGNGVATTINLTVTGSSTAQLIVTSPGYGTLPITPNVWLDASQASSVAQNSSSVTAWNDVSGHNVNFTTFLGTGTIVSINKLNGHSVVTFPGSNGLEATHPAAASPNLTVFTVVRPTATTSYPRALAGAANGNQDYNSVAGFDMDVDNKTAAIPCFQRNQAYNAYNSIPLGTPFIWFGAQNGSTAEYVDADTGNGPLVAVPGQSLAPTSAANYAYTLLAVGAGLTGATPPAYQNGFFGDIAEVLIYEGTYLTTNQQMQVYTYLENKWFIANSLPPMSAVSAPFSLIGTPVFTGLSSPSIVIGTPSVILTGTCKSGTIYPQVGDTINATINGVTVNGSFNDSVSGNFTINYNDPSLATLGLGSYTITYIYGGHNGTLYGATNTSTTLTVTKIPPTVTLNVSNSPVTYNGSSYSAIAGIVSSSVPGTLQNVLTGGAISQINAGTYAVTATFVPTDSAHYSTLNNWPAGNFVIQQATPTATLAVNNSPVTYNPAGQSASVIVVVSSVPGTVANILTGGAPTQTPVGTYAVTANFVPTSPNYATLPGLPAGNFVIVPATPTLSVNNSPATYNGSGQSATITPSTPGVVTNVLTGGAATVTNVGTYAVTASFTPSDTLDYVNVTNASAGNFIIQPGTPKLAVSNSPVSYNGSPQSAVVTSSVPGIVSIVLMNGSTSQTAIGTYAVTANFLPADTNYYTLTAASAGNFVILRATPVVTLDVVNTPAPYNGSPQSALVGVVSSSVSGTVQNVLTGGALSQTAVGTYVVTATFVPEDTTNYTSIPNVPCGNFVISALTPTATLVLNNSSANYTGSGYSASVSIVTSSVPGSAQSVLMNGAASQINAGTYAVTANFVPADNVHYSTLSNVFVGNFVILQATPTVILNIANTPLPYTGSAQSANVVIVNSVPSGTVTNVLTGGAASQTHIGTYAVTATFVPSSPNYTTSTGLPAGNFIIEQATPVLSVNNSPVAYDGAGHSAVVTSSVPGTVSGVLTGGAASQTNAGTYAVTASFVPNDTTDYVSLTNASAGNFVIQSGTSPQLTITISGANVILTWPSSAAGFTLEYTTNLNPVEFWSTNPIPPVMAGGYYTVTNIISGPALFYRLSQ